MLVSEIADDCADILGLCKTDAAFFRRINQGVNILANKSNGVWDGMTGSMDICVDERCVTLPRDIKTPLSLNVDGNPTMGRDKWFEFHVNGPGTNGTDYSRAWDDVGFFPCFKELEEAARVIPFSATATDDGKTITVYGYDESDREVKETLTLSFAGPVASSTTYKRITRVNKDVTTQKVQLYSVDPDTGTSGYMVGWYYGDETQPEYRRIRIPSGASTVTISYIRQTRAIRALTDWIPLSSEMAVLEAVRSVYYTFKGNKERAEQSEATAMRYLNEDQSCRVVNSPVGPQVLNFASNWNESLHDYC